MNAHSSLEVQSPAGFAAADAAVEQGQPLQRAMRDYGPSAFAGFAGIEQLGGSLPLAEGHGRPAAGTCTLRNGLPRTGRCPRSKPGCARTRTKLGSAPRESSGKPGLAFAEHGWSAPGRRSSCGDAPRIAPARPWSAAPVRSCSRPSGSAEQRWQLIGLYQVKRGLPFDPDILTMVERDQRRAASGTSPSANPVQWTLQGCAEVNVRPETLQTDAVAR